MRIRPNQPSLPGRAPEASRASDASKPPPGSDAASLAPALRDAAAAADLLEAPRADVSRQLSGEPPELPLAPRSLAAAFDSIRAPGGPAQARVLSDGLDAWNARWEMLSSAKTSIDADYFILEKDCFGFAFLGALLKKRLEGVQVRLMTDAMADTFGKNGFKMPLRGKDYLQELVNHGADAYIYHPLWQRPGDALKGDFALLASNHDKVLVVDGKRSVTGGRNIAIDYFADPRDRKGAWRDMDIALEGEEVAAGLTAALDDEIAQGNVSRPVSPDRLGNWDKKDLQLLGAAEMMDLWLHDPPFSDAAKDRLRSGPGDKQRLATDLLDRALRRVPASLPEKLRRAPRAEDLAFLEGLAAQLVDQLEARGSAHRFQASALPERATETKILDQTSAARSRANGIAPALKALVDAAKNRIVIENPYVVLTEEMLQSLEAASARGVQIDIITNSPLSTDSAVTQAFFLEDWPYILARCPNARIFVATGDRKFHAKSAVVDGEKAFVSTYNLDLLSGYVNSEVGAIVESEEIAKDLLEAFDADLADPANGFLEYRIKRTRDGGAVMSDGKPEVEFGPEHHLPASILEDYAKKRELWGSKLREHLPWLRPLRHPALSDVG